MQEHSTKMQAAVCERSKVFGGDQRPEMLSVPLMGGDAVGHKRRCALCRIF